MIIRPEQLTVFSEAILKSFLRSVTEHLRYDFADDLSRNAIVGDRLELVVYGAAEQARHYGISSEEHLRFYLECMAILGPEFDSTDPTVRELLTRKNTNVDAKMTELNDYLVFGLPTPR